MARLPSGLSGPAGTASGSSGFSARMRGVGRQVGFFFLRTTVVEPSGVSQAFAADADREGLHRAAGLGEVVEPHVGEIDDDALGLGVGQQVHRRQHDVGALAGNPGVGARIGRDDLDIAQT